MGRRAMSEELLAVSRISPVPAAQTDYDAICAALMHTQRGRWFLDEYAKRNRSADTRLLLAAIERIETVVCAERNKQAQQGFRTDLLEMAKAITRTRAEVAEIRADGASAPTQTRAGDGASPLPQSPRPRDVFAAAERIRDVTWAMRGHGFDPSTCDQLEELAGSILSASALRDPTDHRASKLSEVLQYLERRIDGLLESCTDGDSAEPELISEPDLQAFAPVASREPEHANGFASAHVAEPLTGQITEPCELEAGDFDAMPASPLASATDPGGALPAARIGVEEPQSEDVALEAAEVAIVEVATVAIHVSKPDREAVAVLNPPASAGPDSPTEPEISAQKHGLEAHTGDDTPAAAGVAGGADPAPAAPEPAAAEPVVAEPVAAPEGVAPDGAAPEGTAAELAPSDKPPTAAPDLAVEAQALAPIMKPIDSGQLLPRSPDLRGTAPAARSFLPDVEMRSSMPGREAAWAGPAPPVAAAPQASAAPAVAAQQPANVQAPQADPLAGLKAMSENELIALFS
jgi:hypothetical protein